MAKREEGGPLYEGNTICPYCGRNAVGTLTEESAATECLEEDCGRSFDGSRSDYNKMVVKATLDNEATCPFCSNLVSGPNFCAQCGEQLRDFPVPVKDDTEQDQNQSAE